MNATALLAEDARMTRLAPFGHPFLLGFDDLERTLERLAKNGDGYPPYNIEQTGENGLRITLAVAGFAAADLAVQVEDKQLVIRGKQVDDPKRVFLHRGIAARQFQRGFVLADGIEVVGASLADGLLHVKLARRPLETRVRQVEIRDGAGRPTPLGAAVNV
jgi:HSP20 family molecular chaperone IbpA